MSQTQLLCSVLMARKRSTHTLAESLGLPPGRPRCAPWSSFPFYKIPPVELLQFAVGKGISGGKKVKRLPSSSLRRSGSCRSQIISPKPHEKPDTSQLADNNDTSRVPKIPTTKRFHCTSPFPVWLRMTGKERIETGADNISTLPQLHFPRAISSKTHHFKCPWSHNQIVNHVVYFCHQRKDRGLKNSRKQK